MNLTALIVEDDPVLQILHQKALKALSIESKIAGTGVEAIQALKDSTFDFILMDINMPDQDGLDAARWIRDEQNRAGFTRTGSGGVVAVTGGVSGRRSEVSGDKALIALPSFMLDAQNRWRVPSAKPVPDERLLTLSRSPRHVLKDSITAGRSSPSR
jgi:CheY-like chemotaxis protein